MELLKDEADFFRAKARQGVAGKRGDFLPVQQSRGRTVGVSSPPRIFSSVLLPEPEGPITATHSPFSTVNETWWSALNDGP